VIDELELGTAYCGKCDALSVVSDVTALVPSSTIAGHATVTLACGHTVIVVTPL